MQTELLVRFLVGGLAVSLFAALGEMWKPASFAGLFGAAPSVAIVTLGMSFHRHAPSYVAEAATAMIGGGVAMLIYAKVCGTFARVKGIPVWLEAGLSWVSWFAAAAVVYAVLRVSGVA